VSKSRESYRQHLPALDLSIERYTDAVLADGWYYLLRSGQELGRFKSLNAAREAWTEFVKASGWEPETREMDPKELLLREMTMKENERFFEYWNNSHKFRVRGGMHRNR
jgi:hypothetical protein